MNLWIIYLKLIDNNFYNKIKKKINLFRNILNSIFVYLMKSNKGITIQIIIWNRQNNNNLKSLSKSTKNIKKFILSKLLIKNKLIIKINILILKKEEGKVIKKYFN